MDIDDEQTAQVESDRLMAELLQNEFHRELEGFPEWEQPFEFKGDADSLAEFRKRLQATRCVGCKTLIKMDATEVTRRTGRMLKESRYLHPFFLCAKCKGWSCIECGQYHASDWVPVLKNVASAKDFKSAWCCDHGRMFLVFSLLCGLEPSPSATPSSPKKRAKSRKGESSSGTAQPEQSGAKSRSKYLQPHLSKGTGYGDELLDAARNTGQSQAWRAVDDDTDDLRLRFEALSMILPSGIKGTTPFDCSPNPTVSEMIRRSPMLQHASELLRHASIEEINERCGPIVTVLDFLETVASHFSTCPLLLRERTLFPPTEQLAHVVLKGTKHQGSAGTAAYETAQPLAAIVELLAVPCRRFVETSRRLSNMNVDEGEGDLLAVVERICGIADGLGALRAQLPRKEPQDACEPSSSSSSRPTANVTTRGMRATADKTAEDTATQEVAKRVSDWHRANCVKEVPDDVILNSSSYAGEARKADNSKPAPGRMRKLLAQVSSLSTDLPDGIYVRHGESRVDVLKILIVGPADTPYEHGLFEFDMFVGSEFPKFPPKMYFRTTGGGRARFNPNLYVNGKVCFSLLGTWQGQPWEPDRSTILQLLVSIQAMIFNDQPYYNEPGYELRDNPTSSQHYNRIIEQLTIRYAMLPWLTERLAGGAESDKTSRTSSAKTQISQLSIQEATGATPDPDPMATLNYPTKLTPAHLATAAKHHLLPGTWGMVPGHQGTWTTSHAYSSDLLPIKAQPGSSASHAHPSNVVPTQGPPASLACSHAHPANTTGTETQPSQLSPFGEHADANIKAKLTALASPGFPSNSMSEFMQESLSVFHPYDGKVPQAPRIPAGEDDPVFGDVIRNHFKVKARIIMATVQKWEKQAGQANEVSLAAVAHQLELLMSRHGFTN
ncbi:hypothetical protein C8A01DRAFT_18093 [Parachaetomium inaequale]|uniref:UBC core domain-containing protein n=1 Tax=Parachaetomium inaequale TaxID=2588326 RepID=A0AAN6PB97_9PEZI|nr:hypothetical protein C8A01DRAFT_18093 [Parachaetomium inaequale]